MKYVKNLANGITIIALAFIAFSSFTTSKANEARAYSDYQGEGMLGEIRINGTHFEPQNWRFCEGQTIEVARNQKLYQMIGIRYGGDETTFKLPNLPRLFNKGTDAWDPYNHMGKYMICTIGYSPNYWDTWDSYYDDGIPSGF